MNSDAKCYSHVGGNMITVLKLKRAKINNGDTMIYNGPIEIMNIVVYMDMGQRLRAAASHF